ncbi:hypothetical protein ES705_38365 [subsurface metagenome]
MTNLHQDLGTDLHIRIYQGIERFYNAAAHGIFYRHKAQVAMSFADFFEDTFDICHRFVFDTLAELKHRRGMAETAAGAEIGNP